MKNALIAIAFLLGAAGAHAQATTAVKEAGKATAETAKQGTENTKAAVSDEPKKSAAQGQGLDAQGQGQEPRHRLQGSGEGHGQVRRPFDHGGRSRAPRRKRGSGRVFSCLEVDRPAGAAERHR